MPTYSYRCPQCGPFAAVRRMADFNQPTPCPICAGESQRMLTVPALLGARRPEAVDKNNRSTDSASTYPRLTHTVGCGCC